MSLEAGRQVLVLENQEMKVQRRVVVEVPEGGEVSLKVDMFEE